MMDLVNAAGGFALLSEPNRLLILRALAQGEQSATQLLQELPVSQPTLSHHMKLLCDWGLVRRRRQGQRTLYTLDRAALSELLAVPLAGTVREEPAQPPTPTVIVRSGHR